MCLVYLNSNVFLIVFHKDFKYFYFALNINRGIKSRTKMVKVVMEEILVKNYMRMARGGSTFQYFLCQIGPSPPRSKQVSSSYYTGPVDRESVTPDCFH